MLSSPRKQGRHIRSKSASHSRSDSSSSLMESDFERLLNEQEISLSLRERLRTMETPVKETFLRSAASAAQTKAETKHTKRASLSLFSPKRRQQSKIAMLEMPSQYSTYLKTTQPQDIKVEHLIRLKMLLRNERLAWVSEFISTSGSQALQVLCRITVALEWRDDHQDAVLHEVFECLRALYTNKLGAQTIETDLLCELVQFLLSDKRPASYKTRHGILKLVEHHIQASDAVACLVVLQWFKRPTNILCDIPLDFLQQAHKPRPYKVWIQQIEHVCQECFWIFLHDNHIPCLSVEEVQNLGTRRPIVPSGYIGGIEWEAVDYLCGHLSICNQLLGRLPPADRRQLRKDLKASHFEHICGQVLRKASTQYFSYLHEELTIWVANAAADKWPIDRVAYGSSKGSSKSTESNVQLPELKFD